MKRAALVAVVLLAARADAQRDTGWELRIPERVELVTGTSGTLPITITVDRGRTISKDAGLTIDLAPEAAGLLAVSLGFSRMYRDDLAQLEAAMTIYDGFYRWCRDASEETHNWPSPKAKA